jgi:hypothetical protein
MPGRKAEPSAYVATQDLHVYNPESGSMPVAAYRAGDKVPPDLVASNGWADKVRPLDALTPAPVETAAYPAETE